MLPVELQEPGVEGREVTPVCVLDFWSVAMSAGDLPSEIPQSQKPLRHALVDKSVFSKE